MSCPSRPTGDVVGRGLLLFSEVSALNHEVSPERRSIVCFDYIPVRNTIAAPDLTMYQSGTGKSYGGAVYPSCWRAYGQ